MSRPNVVLFTWHDAGDWFGCYGHDTVQTPNVERLACEGVRFTANHSACAICSPSRAAIATGRFCQNNGVMTLANSPFSNRIHPHVPHIAARFKEMGYRSALFGVQHEAAHEHVHEVLKVDEQFATDPWPQSDLTADYVRRWIAARAGDDTPFYAQVGTIDAHLNRFYSDQPPRDDEPYPPVQDTTRGIGIPPYLAGSDADRATVATLQGLLQRGDRLMGALLESLDEAGLAENTVVVMCVDHGVGLSRAKATCYDAGTKTGWIVRWPGVVPAGRTVDALTTHVDVLPTLWDLLGHAPIGGLDGVSLAAHIRGERNDDVHDAVFSHMVENTRSIRTRRWKLIRNFRPPSWVGRRGDCATQHRGYESPFPPMPGPEVPPSPERPLLELYDLENDPWEQHTLADDPAHAATRDGLDARLWDFLLHVDDFLVHDPVRSRWQQATREQLQAHCRRAGRACPVAEGPLGNPIDAASARGAVCG